MVVKQVTFVIEKTKCLSSLAKRNKEFVKPPRQSWSFRLRFDEEDPEDIKQQEQFDTGSQIFTGLFLAGLFSFVLFNFN